MLQKVINYTIPIFYASTATIRITNYAKYLNSWHLDAFTSLINMEFNYSRGV